MVVAQNKVWSSCEIDEARCSDLSQEANCSPQVAALLLSRGIDSGEKAQRFLHPRLVHLLDPGVLPEIDKAAERINGAIAQNESICVFGDYDVDGVTSTCLLLNFFQQVGKEVAYRLPDRFKGGYGLNCDVIRELASAGVQLLITVDNGSSSQAEIALAAELGMDVVVCDHHQPSEDSPNPIAHVNPWLSDDESVFKDLAGVGVTYKLVWELCRCFTRQKKLSEEFSNFMRECLGLAALGTIADMVPLHGENRILAKFGLQKLRESRKPGISKLVNAALKRDASRDHLTSEDVGFSIGPKINAAGRLSNADFALRLLMAEDNDQADELIQVLDRENNKRKKIGAEIFEDVCNRIETAYDLGKEKVIVLGDEAWHPGVLGIVASRVVEKYYRPAFLFSIEEGIAKGSARSIKGVEMCDALAECGDLFERFGGHAMAAGGTLQAEKLDALRAALNEIIDIDPSAMVPEIEFDCQLELEEIDNVLLSEVARLEPFGAGNSEPLFATMDLEIVGSPKLMGKDGRHISFHVRKKARGKTAFRAVAFFMGDRCEEISRGNRVSLLYRPRINSWRGKSKIELHIKDLLVHES
jgi:single-stranded-DNA-specific exonuclease